MKHVALLRGINVGGKNIVPMKDLAALFEAAGCRDVTTYIQSGNVIFTAPASVLKKLPATVSNGLADFLGAMDDHYLQVACLSNDVAEWSLSLRRRFRLNERLIHWTISGDVGARKPDAAIYQRLLNATGREPEDCIFVDDRVRNIDTARDMGFKTVLFTRNSDNGNRHPRASSFQELQECVLGLAPSGASAAGE